MSRARVESKTSGLATSAKVEALRNRNLEGRPWRPPLVVRLACNSEASRWRAATMIEGLGICFRPLKGTSSDNDKPTQ